jgi:diaminopimelate epimerase
VDFEKWHALGNDYLIVESAALPFELTPERIRRICAAHTGVFADGILVLSSSEDLATIARLAIYNPDGSEAELSGNGAREAALYVRRRGWTDANTFSLRTEAGPIGVTVTSPTTCTIELGEVRLRSPDYPSGAPDGRGVLTAGGRSWPFQHVQVGNPQCAIRVADERLLGELDLPAIGPEIECSELFPNRTNVSWFAATGDRRIRARIFERGVGETRASGTGATGAAVAYVLDGGESPVSVQLEGGELEVAVAGDLRTSLTGSAVPVFAGKLAADFVEELHASE